MCTAPPIGAATAAGCAAFVRPRWRGCAINRRSLKAEGLTNLREPALAAEKGERPATPCNKSLRFSETGAHTRRSRAARRGRWRHPHVLEISQLGFALLPQSLPQRGREHRGKWGRGPLRSRDDLQEAR